MKYYQKSKWNRKGSLKHWGYYKVNWARRQVKKKQTSYWRYQRNKQRFLGKLGRAVPENNKEKLNIEKFIDMDRFHGVDKTVIQGK